MPVMWTGELCGMMDIGALLRNEYARLLAEVKDRIRAAQYDALRAVNKE